jgi:hypothetical protein
VYSEVGVVYAVVLAMVVVGVWDARGRAHANTYTETNAVLQLYWYGQSLPRSSGGWIAGLAEQYTRSVLDIEWPLLARQRSSPQVWKIFTELRTLINSHQPENPGDEIRYQQALDAMAQLGDARRERVNEAAQSSVPRLMWAALILGALITIGFAFLFNLGSREVHAVLVFFLTLIIGCLLLLVHELNYPFSGPVGVEPTAFRLALDRITTLG